MQKYQYTVMSEPKKGRWYPFWRTRDGEAWKYFMDRGKEVYFTSQSEALQFVATEQRKVEGIQEG